MSFWCLQIFQKNNDFFSRISALASNKKSNQKIRALDTTNWRILFWLSYTTFLISRLVQKYKNIFVRFLVQMKSLKFTSEIYWPLCRKHYYCPNVYIVALLLSINGLFSNWCWLSTRVMWCDIFPMYLFFHHYYSQKGSISHPSKKQLKKAIW